MFQLLKTVLVSVAVVFSVNAQAEELNADQKAKVEKFMNEAKAWAAHATIVDAVKAQNASPSADVKAMDQKKWEALTLLDPTVRGFTKNAAAEFLKSKKTEVVSEAFLSSADGTKVAFLSKTSNWSHKGKGKHDKPMAGQTWIGEIEVDESTGAKQVQFAIPVMDGGKAIGSLCVGVNIAKLK